MLFAAPQDPADAGYTQLLCGSSDEDNDEDDVTGRGESRFHAGETRTAADRLLAMLELDYRRCVEGGGSGLAVRSSHALASVDKRAMVDMASCRHVSSAGAIQDTVDEAASGENRHEPRAASKGIAAADQDASVTGNNSCTRFCVDDSGLSASSVVDADGDTAAPADNDCDTAAPAARNSVAVNSDNGAFAQAVAETPIDDVRVAMAGITLPPAAWPSWAQDMSEKELLVRLQPRTSMK